ncbi:MAG TPA: PBSX family phage terminase large subunit [Bacteroidia bacterium]|jgi:phage terminase large subunit|nr:PBSX family phage terminase large subunit [Bacteroidia bacterium]
MKNIEIEINTSYINAFRSDKRFLFLYGGAGSGKSQFAARKILYRMINETGHRFLIVRKEKCHVRESMYTLLKDIIEYYNLTHQFSFRNDAMQIIHNETGNEILSAGLLDSDKIKSISGITGIWVEEAFELEKKDFDQLNLRLRGITGNYKQIICTFNPMDTSHWLKTMLDRKPDNLLALQTTFTDNMFIDKEYMDELISQYKQNENFARVYIKGDWGRAYTGGEFYHGFSWSKHVDTVKYNSALPLHITFDFNVNPYVTCCVWQLDYNSSGELKKVLQLDEICLSHPRNSTKQVCAEFRRKYFNEKGHTAGLFVYGDPSGKHEDTRSEKGHNDFTIIRNELKDMHPTMRIADKAPSVKSRGDFINSILESEYDGISILINEYCKNSIDDFLYIKQDANGVKLKEKAKDEKTGGVYEKYGHTSDSADYFLTTVFSPEFTYFLNGEKKFNPVYGKKTSNNLW